MVTAVDQVGNESVPSNSFYLNFELLPVATLEVVQHDANLNGVRVKLNSQEIILL